MINWVASFLTDFNFISKKGLKMAFFKYYTYISYMCKSSEISDETRNIVLKFFFEHTFGARFFSLFVV